MITLAHEVSVSLSLTVISQDDESLKFSIAPLLQLTRIFMLYWWIGLIVNRVRYDLEMLRIDVLNLVETTSKLFLIGINSLAWGVFT